MKNRYVIMLKPPSCPAYRITKPGTVWKIDSKFNFNVGTEYVIAPSGVSYSIDPKDAKIIELHELEEVIYGY